MTFKNSIEVPLNSMIIARRFYGNSLSNYVVCGDSIVARCYYPISWKNGHFLVSIVTRELLYNFVTI